MTDKRTQTSDSALIEELARALAKTERLNWDEVCPLENNDNAECDSSTCIAAHDEDHDPAWARKVMLVKAQAILPIIRRLQLEAGEKVKEATLSVHVPFGGRESYDGGVEDYEKAIRALDVAVIIGASHD